MQTVTQGELCSEIPLSNQERKVVYWCRRFEWALEKYLENPETTDPRVWDTLFLCQPPRNSRS